MPRVLTSKQIQANGYTAAVLMSNGCGDRKIAYTVALAVQEAVSRDQKRTFCEGKNQAALIGGRIGGGALWGIISGDLITLIHMEV